MRFVKPWMLLSAALAVLLGTGRASAFELDSVNAVLGDASFVAQFGRAPGPDDSEELRITTHLAFVERILAARDVRELSPELRRERARNIARLREYRLRGIFPRNTEVEGRSPRFIDHEGRICAAGHLVERSAGRALAEAINRRHEHAFIHEMKLPELDAWIAKSGLSRQEVAMIQPGYGFRPPEPAGRPTQGQLLAAVRSAEAEVRRCVALHEPSTSALALRALVRLSPNGSLRVDQRANRAVSQAFTQCARRAIERRTARLARPFDGSPVAAVHVFRVTPANQQGLAQSDAEDLLASALPELVRCTLPSRTARAARITVTVVFNPAGDIGQVRTFVPPGDVSVASCLHGVVAALPTRSFSGKPVEATLSFRATVSSRKLP